MVEIRPPDAVPGTPIDGTYAVDTTGFDEPTLRFGIGCIANPGCTIDYAITISDGGKPMLGSGGQLNGADPPSPVEVSLPTAAMVTILFNANIVSPVAFEDRALWIDPRVEEATPQR